MSTTGATIVGLPELQAAAQKLRQAMAVGGGLGGAVAYATKAYGEGLRAAVHVDTGTYQAAQAVEINGLVGRAYTSDKRNPRTGQSAAAYGPYEESRGGSHAAYATTYGQQSPRIAGEALTILLGSLP
jgi:hypothetical protein